jgi:mRNA-degrading endonuclease toxin of MazEF toxin-antitoxin module
MGLNRGKIVRYENKVHSSQVGAIRGRKAYEDPDLVADIELVSRSIFPYLIRQDMDYAIKWLLGCDRYVKDKTNEDTSNNFPFRAYTISRGEIIYVDFFGHFDTELTFFHPAVVIAEVDRKHILIAPTSTPAYGSTNPLYINLTPADATGVMHNCGIKLDNIRIVSKRRITKRFGKISNVAILDQIDDAFTRNFVAMKQKVIDEQNIRIQTLAREVVTKDEQIDHYNLELQRREIEIEELKATIEALQSQIGKTLQVTE